jgi:arabinose-5-phosphate isomerase
MSQSHLTPQDLMESVLRAIDLETQGIQHMQQRLSAAKVHAACSLLLECQSKVIVIGMGKSGHIGKKIAATLASTGTPAFFVHPGEASHGDMGMITKKDLVIALSNSGETQEVMAIVPLIKRLGVPLISMTGREDSALALAADVHLYVGVDKEACPLDLAPTASTTAALVLGDAIAVAVLEARGFTANDFAYSHPGGSLGRRLLLKVKDIMHSGDQLPLVAASTSIKEALLEMTAKGLGLTCVVSEHKLLGIFTDGDLRRALDKNVALTTPIADVMSKSPKVISPNMLAAEALAMMEENQINAIIVVDDLKPIGALNMHDLLQAGVY